MSDIMTGFITRSMGSCTWMIRVENDVYKYGFRITPKSSISPDQKRQEIKEILRQTEELCGNRQGNDFITTQINYDG